MDEETLALYCPTRSLTMKKTKIPQADSLSVLLAARALMNRNMLSSYYNLPVYEDLGRKRHEIKTDGVEETQAIVQTFRKRAIKLPEQVNDKHGSDHNLSTVPGRFCAVQYISDAMFFVEYVSPNNERLKAKGKIISSFYSANIVGRQ